MLSEESHGPPAGWPHLAWDDPRLRLYGLRGAPCPLCARREDLPPPLTWTGVSLACPCGHGWSNPDALRADLTGPK